MSDDLVRRLRTSAGIDDVHDAADLIEAQAAEIARLRATISQIMTPGDNYKRLNAALATARREAEQKRDEFFNRLGRITEYMDIPVDATAQRIIEAIQERIDNEREACASVEVRLTVPEGAETWTPLEAWEEALLAFDEAFRDAIRAAAKKDREP